MTHSYKVRGMTCGGCEAKVKSDLLMVPGVTEVTVSRTDETATISMEKHIPLSAFQSALYKKYTISPM
ncbi:MAG: heavy metal-associated domain-containing protein, partial [Daejeonella sp.]